MLVRPNTVVCLNSIISKVDKSLWAQMRSKYYITHILEIVFLIILLVRIYLRITKIKSEVKVVIVILEKFLNLIRRCTRSRRICSVVAGCSSNDVLRWIFRRILSIEVHNCVHWRAKPSAHSQLLESLYNILVICKIFSRTSLERNKFCILNNTVYPLDYLKCHIHITFSVR